MSLEIEIKSARHDIISDGYDMSIGEIMNLYRDEELIINPEYQRYFRWEHSQKTKFIESLLLGIPVPPIFVYQTDDGKWELVDGLQRLSTIFEFTGILKAPEGGIVTPSCLAGTQKLPSLKDVSWDESGGSEGIGTAQQLDIKRTRFRVEILKKESDPFAKYELFQRLNTGGSKLSEQEVRNCVAIMVNSEFYNWLHKLSEEVFFVESISQTKTAQMRQKEIELALRFFIYRNVPYDGILDVHEYLDKGLIDLASDQSFDKESEGKVFNSTFRVIHEALAADTFKRWDGGKFSGMFLLSAFETAAVGISKNIEQIDVMSQTDRNSFISDKVKGLWSNDTYCTNSGSGVRGSTRLPRLLSLGESYFKP